ncbi:MAG: hypothetical protein VKJ06_08040 [Vampirovibrionales bacterium]|nr:hypothetical protein [Vampirovibrionales bacterium]
MLSIPPHIYKTTFCGKKYTGRSIPTDATMARYARQCGGPSHTYSVNALLAQLSNPSQNTPAYYSIIGQLRILADQTGKKFNLPMARTPNQKIDRIRDSSLSIEKSNIAILEELRKTLRLDTQAQTLYVLAKYCLQQKESTNANSSLIE